MMRRLPMIPTIVVLLAVGTMVALGVWQLQRMAWKDDLLARRIVGIWESKVWIW